MVDWLIRDSSLNRAEVLLLALTTSATAKHNWWDAAVFVGLALVSIAVRSWRRP